MTMSRYSVSDMRNAVAQEATSSGKPQLLITVAAPADPAKFALIQVAIYYLLIIWVSTDYVSVTRGKPSVTKLTGST